MAEQIRRVRQAYSRRRTVFGGRAVRRLSVFAQERFAEAVAYAGETVDGLDTDCVGDVRRPPFFVTPAGPDPAEGDSIPR